MTTRRTRTGDTLSETVRQTVTVIPVSGKLIDVSLQASLFQDLEPGRYILEYRSAHSVQPVSVYWTGTEVSA